MKRIIFSLFIFVCCFFGKAISQSCPTNLDFEMGDFTGWECFTGKTLTANGSNVINLSLSGPVKNRHEIISDSSGTKLDPYGKFPVLCPYGGKYSVKLGNATTGSESEGISYTFTVPSIIDTFTFTYFYAVVFQDPAHLAAQQPRFFVTAYEVASGNLINCASFDYISNGAIPGFKQASQSSDILFKDWSPASLQFAGMGGKDVRLEFKTADCTLGGHFGYAYVDVGSACSNIMATAPYCKETNSLILNAPYGFKNYTWYNQDFSAVIGKTQSLTLSPPPATTGVFYVDVEPYPGYGCRDTLQAFVKPLPVPDTPSAISEQFYCQYQNIPALQAIPARGHDLLWYTSATGGVGSNRAPIPSSAQPGTFTYYVSQKVLFGCESFRKKITVNIIKTPAASFNTNGIKQCQNGNNYIFTSTSANLSNSTYTWDFGDGETLSSLTDSVVNHTYTKSGNFIVKLKASNFATCSSEKSVTVIVVPKPVATFTYPSIICEKQTPLTIVNTSSVTSGLSTIARSWWSINGAIEEKLIPSLITPAKPGPLAVKLVVSTPEGCNSDTNNTIINVHYRPTAAAKFEPLLCNNEIIYFTDLSFLPGTAVSESIVKWNWQFDNSMKSGQQHPSLNLPAGIQHARLITESNFGCRSIEMDSLLTIYAKPQIRLLINDSCVFRTIRYQASDVSASVNRWYWNFGDGLKTGSSIISKSYSTEGYRPLTLIGQTIDGCKDTIIRPFTIYDNKAMAGKDTIAASNEPVQLNARGGANVNYSWSPALGLSNVAIENPVAILDREQVYRLDAITDKGCDSHSRILIKRFNGPELYIPGAFTPNKDGLNELLKVFPVGIRSFNFFAVYNRYGQQVFYTTNYSEGWDGTYKGEKLASGAFVAYSTAVDYRGNPLIKKITVMLIR
jgi:gliding motility-associated-like protein